MAEIGRSTAAHTTGNTQSERDIERLLTNWGDFIAFLPGYLPAGYPVQPMFKEYVAGYNIETRSRRSPENVDAAEALDPILATLSERDISCLICAYVLRLSSRKAATLLSTVESHTHIQDSQRRKLKCNHSTYAEWLSTARVNAELRITYATGIELDRKPVYGMKKVATRKIS